MTTRSAADDTILRSKSIATILNIIGLFLLLHIIIVKPLKKDALSMEHRDPVDIIAVPFPLHTLAIFSLLSISYTLSISLVMAITDLTTTDGKPTEKDYSSSSHQTEHVPKKRNPNRKPIIGCLFDATRGLLGGGLLVFAFSVLAGASPVQNVGHTFLSSIYLASLAFGPSFVYPNFFSTPENLLRLLIASYEDGQQHLNYHDSTSASASASASASPSASSIIQHPPLVIIRPSPVCERINRWSMYGTFIVTVPCMILLILDWGAQVQRWPVPVLLGSTMGYATGSALGIIIGWMGTCYDNQTNMKSKRQNVDKLL